MDISIKDKKIYVYVIGVVLGTILYNCINMDFSFALNKVLEVDFLTYFIYLFIDGLKFLIVIYLIWLLTNSRILLMVISFGLCLLFGGAITIFIKYGTSHIFVSVINYLFKIFMCGLVSEKGKNIKSFLICTLFVLISALLQNFFIKIF